MDVENGEAIPLDEMGKKHWKYKFIFEECDTNNDGYICLSELDAFINSDRYTNYVIPRYVRLKIHKMADKDGDKQLDLQEFTEMLEHEDFHQLFERYVNQYINFLIPKPPVEPIARDSVLGRSIYLGEGEVYGREYMYQEYTCFPPPIFIFLISIIEFLCFLTDELTQKDSTLSGTGVTAKIFIYDPKKKAEVWRFLTYMLVHIGYQHLVVNLIVQMILGVFLEMVHKWRVIVIYLAGVIAGSLAHSIADPHVRLGGASGGVYSLMTAHIANVIMNWSQMIYPYIQLSVFTIIVGVDLGPALYQRYYLNIYDYVGVAAHGGGALAGLLIGIDTLRNLKFTNTEKYIWWAALIIYIVMMAAAIIFNICP